MPPWLYFTRPYNIAFHNLCNPLTEIPPRTRSLLGLGLNFCPRPPRTSRATDVDFDRFQRDCKTRLFFAGNNRPPPNNKLFIRSNWQPDPQHISTDFCSRLDRFAESVKSNFRSRCAVSNLLPFQNQVLESLRSNSKLIVIKTDKNLGPAIIERNVYIQRALLDHLFDTTTYCQLDESTAHQRTDAIQQLLRGFINSSFPAKSNDRTFLERYQHSVRDPFAYFYLLAKIHKSPWKTRPIISCSGSLLHGLGQWVDHQLQCIIRHLPYVLSSSTRVVELVRGLTVADTATFFTCDATSMYTNIDTPHALSVIEDFFRSTDILAKEKIDGSALLRAIKLIMYQNLFKFGDTFWVQLTGTAMGTPPAPMYATLYFCIHEMQIIPNFAKELGPYGRYIDDGFGIWTPNPLLSLEEDATRFALLQTQFSSFGSLRWVFSQRTRSIDFLDVTLTMSPKGRVESCLFEKALNLYLFLPPHSNHPPGMVKGLIRGMFCRIERLTTNPMKRNFQIQQFFRRLRVRGYDREFLLPLFRLTRTIQAPTPNQYTQPIYLHVPFHALDPSSSIIQSAFTRIMQKPIGSTPLRELLNHRGAPFIAERLIVAYHRPRNLGNILSRRRLSEDGVAVSSVIANESRPHLTLTLTPNLPPPIPAHPRTNATSRIDPRTTDVINPYRTRKPNKTGLHPTSQSIPADPRTNNVSQRDPRTTDVINPYRTRKSHQQK